MPNLIPRDVPCPSCPYRRNCPSGVWHASEYEKLPAYDNETFAQPVGVFMCHDAKDGQTMCRGWLDVHDKENLLSLRLAAGRGLIEPDLIDLPPSGVPVFASGAEAAEHGMAEIDDPRAAALRVIDKLFKRKETSDDGSVPD